MNYLNAGTGRADITPAPGTPQGGWGAQTHQRGEGADFPLFATALVLSDGETCAAIIDADAIGFDVEWTGKIIDKVAALTGIPRAHIRFSCSHTHSGPNTFRLPVITEGLDMVLSYLDNLPHQIAGAVWQAQRNHRPVRCAAGSGTCDIGMNRRLKLEDGRVVVGRNPSGPVDHTVRVVRFDDLQERPVATIVHYACHPTTMAWQNKLVTPDYPGVVRHVVEQQIGGTCLFLQGATGNIQPRRGFTGDLNVYRKLGSILGLAAAHVAQNLETYPRQEKLVGLQESGAVIALYEDTPVEPEPPVLRVRSRMMRLPVKPTPPVSEAEQAAVDARTELNRLRNEGDGDEVRGATARATQAGIHAELARLYHGKTHIEWPLQVICVGSIAFVSLAGEPFIEIARQIVSDSPFRHTLVSGYSNGGFGYIPVREAFAEGGYEVATSPFTPDAADEVIRQAVGLLNELAALPCTEGRDPVTSKQCS